MLRQHYKRTWSVLIWKRSNTNSVKIPLRCQRYSRRFTRMTDQSVSECKTIHRATPLCAQNLNGFAVMPSINTLIEFGDHCYAKCSFEDGKWNKTHFALETAWAPDWLISCLCVTSVLNQEHRKLHIKWVCLEDAKPYLVFIENASGCSWERRVLDQAWWWSVILRGFVVNFNLLKCRTFKRAPNQQPRVVLAGSLQLYGSSRCNSPPDLCLWKVDYHRAAFVKRPESLGGFVQGRTALDYVDFHAIA